MDIRTEPKAQTHIKVNSGTLFALLRVLEEALPLVDAAVFEDDLLDDEERGYWAADLERVESLLRVINPSHSPTTWLLKPYVHADDFMPITGVAHV